MSANIVYIKAITENSPLGQVICRAELGYDHPVAGGVPAAAFRVEGRTVTSVQVCGCSVFLELDPSEEGALVIPPPPKPKEGRTPAPKKMDGPPRNMPPAVRRPISVMVTQTADIPAADGSVIPAWGPRPSDRAEEPVVDDFQQFELDGMFYNLFTPKALEEGRRYPLVLFIHDAGPRGSDPKLTLSQGLGAVSFADEAWQRKHPCFVLAPQVGVGEPMTNDEFQVTGDFDKIKAILDHVAETYPVDKKRMYATGQSMGCMASCEFNIRWPELFAASLLVAGQWSPERMAENCSRNKLWILVSEHDVKAFPGMNAVTEAMEQAGAAVSRCRWDGSIEPEVLSRLARQEAEQDANVHYTVFEGFTVVAAGFPDHPGTNHVHTWRVAYTIDGLKEWLFSNSK